MGGARVGLGDVQKDNIWFALRLEDVGLEGHGLGDGGIPFQAPSLVWRQHDRERCLQAQQQQLAQNLVCAAFDRDWAMVARITPVPFYVE